MSAKTLLMGPTRWTVKSFHSIKGEGDELLDGLCDRSRHVLSIQWGLPPIRKAGVTLHEVLHAAFDVSGLHQSFSGATEERIVAAMEAPLLEALRRNKWLVDTLLVDVPWWSKLTRKVGKRR